MGRGGACWAGRPMHLHICMCVERCLGAFAPAYAMVHGTMHVAATARASQAGGWVHAPDQCIGFWAAVGVRSVVMT